MWSLLSEMMIFVITVVKMLHTHGVQASESGVNFDHCDDECCCCQDYRPCWVDASSVVFTLIDGGKLANQIATLLSIVVKILLAL